MNGIHTSSLLRVTDHATSTSVGFPRRCHLVHCKMGAPARIPWFEICVAGNIWGLINVVALLFLRSTANSDYCLIPDPHLFIAGCSHLLLLDRCVKSCMILPHISADYRRAASMKVIHGDQRVICWLCLSYAKSAYIGRCTRNDAAGKKNRILIFTVYFHFPVVKVDTSLGCD